MKKIGMTLVIGSLLFTSCKKQEETRSEEPPAPAEKAITSAPTATPAEVAAIPNPIPATPAPTATPSPTAELAPPGVFYLIALARVETDSGIVGLPPGTGVKHVRDNIYLTPSGEFPLDSAILTNSLAVARKARDADRTAQAAMQARSSAEATSAKMQGSATANATDAAHKAAVDQIERQRVETRLAALLRQKQDLEVQQSALFAQRQKESFNEVYKGRVVASTTETRLKTVKAQISTIDAQIADTQIELKRFR